MSEISKNSYILSKYGPYNEIIYRKDELFEYIKSIEPFELSAKTDDSLEFDREIHRSAIALNLLSRLSEQLNKERFGTRKIVNSKIIETIHIMTSFNDVISNVSNAHPAELVLFEIESNYLAEQIVHPFDLSLNRPPEAYLPYEIYEQLVIMLERSLRPIERTFLPYILLKMCLVEKDRYSRLSAILYNIRNKNPITYQVA